MAKSTLQRAWPMAWAVAAWLAFDGAAAAQQPARAAPQPAAVGQQAGGAGNAPAADDRPSGARDPDDCRSISPRRRGIPRYWDGAPDSRRCLLLQIRGHRRGALINDGVDRATWVSPLQYSENLGDYYLARSDRFQAYLDGGTLATGVGALGAALSSAAGPATVEAWGYGAVAGILLVNFTGSEPMRDLYYAGHLGVGYVESRYVVLVNRLRSLETLNPQSTAACGGEGDASLVAVEAWGDGADKAAFLPIAQQIAATCRDMSRGRIQLRTLTDEAIEARATMVASFDEDLLALDAHLTEADRQLRATPSSALTSGAVGALRVLDALISGEDTQEAVNRVKINALLDDFNLRLAPIAIASPPQPIEAGIELGSSFQARAAVSGRMVRAGQNLPNDHSVRNEAARIRRLQAVIETERTPYNRAVYNARLLHDAARRSELRFDYQVTTGTATVGLFDPAAPRSVDPAAAAPIPAPAAGASPPAAP